MRPKRARRATQLLPEHETPSANGPSFVRGRSRVCADLSPARGAFPHPFAVFLPSGGGGNRTRVRNRPDQSVYKLRLPLRFARRPVGSRPTDGLAILWRRASGDWLSLGAEPVSDAATRATGRARSDALRYGLGSESECGVVLRTYVKSRLFNEANRGPRLAALPENRPRRNQVAPVCQFRNCSRRWPASWWARTSAVRSSKKNVDPFSSFGSTQMRPPMRSISSRQM